MSATVTRLVNAPTCLQWWEWFKLAGALALLSLLATLVNGIVPSPFVVALVLHIALDFTLQSDQVAIHKPECGKYLLLHALAAGGLPMAIGGLFVGPATALIGAVVGAVSHYAVDWTRKFGLPAWWKGIAADQLCHLIVVALLVVGLA